MTSELYRVTEKRVVFLVEYLLIIILIKANLTKFGANKVSLGKNYFGQFNLTDCGENPGKIIYSLVSCS